MSMGIIKSGEYNKVAGLGGDVSVEGGDVTLTDIGITADRIDVSYIKVGRLVTLRVFIVNITSGQPAASSYDVLSIGTLPAKLKPVIRHCFDCHFQASETPYIADVAVNGQVRIWQWGQPTAMAYGSDLVFTVTYVAAN